MLRTVTVFAIILLFIGSSCNRQPPSEQMRSEVLLTEYQVHYNFDTYSFYRPNAITSDSLFLYISDAEDGTIAVFDAALNLQQIIGNKGQGPLEFNMISDILALDKSIFVFDNGNGRISRVSPGGDSLDSIRHPVGKRSSLSASRNSTILLSSVSVESEARIQEYNLNLEPLRSLFPIADVEQRMASSRGTDISFDNNDQMILMTSHLPYITTSDETDIFRYDYSDAFISIYPYFKYFLRSNTRMNKRSGSYIGLFCFGKGVLLDKFYIMPGPRYSLVILDTRSFEIAFINTGEIADDLSKWGYGSFADVGIFRDSVFLPTTSASVVVIIGLDELKQAINEVSWYSPSIINMEDLANVKVR